MSPLSTTLRRVEDDAACLVWPSLLALRRFLTRAENQHDVVAIYSEEEEWCFAEDLKEVPASAFEVLLLPLGDGDAELTRALDAVAAPTVAAYRHDRFLSGESPLVSLRGSLTPGIETCYRFYLPSLVGGFRARLAGGVFVLGHLAQTLDGRIACRNGQSQWISNEANLHHAHRLRALHDGVLVGGRTIELDNPRLTVRHVVGEDPVRIVLTSSASVLRAEGDYHVFDEAGSTVLCRAGAADGIDLEGRNLDLVPVELSEEGLFPPAQVRRELAARGIHTVFVEGGGRTLSRFLEDDALDVLQVHIAPVVLGSGISGFQLPEVSSISAGKRMTMEQFAMDGEVLLECRTRRDAGSKPSEGSES